MQHTDPSSARTNTAASEARPEDGRVRPWKARSSVILGMSQLDGCGLSESWIQKTCGEVHWRGLAVNQGCPAERWTDTDGQRVYAAFGIVRLKAARLNEAKEGPRLRLESRLSPVGRSQAWSRHRLVTQSGDIGQLEMLSVFVGRDESGSNRSVRRAPMRDHGATAVPAAAQDLADKARAWRAAVSAEAAAAREDLPAKSLRFMSCPRSDFNGAGLVYFATFTTWTDRALFSWQLVGAQDRVVERECLYLGNLDIGQEVEVRLRACRPGDTGQCFETEIRSPRDDRLLARIRTTLVMAASGASPTRAAPACRLGNGPPPVTRCAETATP